MGWRIVVLGKSGSIYCKQNQLVYDYESESVKIPIEDISVIILESKEIQLTSYLLSECANHNVAIFTCDSTHTPNAIFTPYFQHSRMTQMATEQIAWSQPFKNRLWQRLIKSKIQNQIDVLGENGNDLKFLLDQVESGDKRKTEAVAARMYWPRVFEKFKRGDGENIINGALNYAYAIMRGAIARQTAACGFIPCIGVFHSSTLNAFNLVDDLLEPFRPLADQWVRSVFENDHQIKEVSPYLKRKLVMVLTQECKIEGEKVTPLFAIERMLESVRIATLEKDPSRLIVPQIVKR